VAGSSRTDTQMHIIERGQGDPVVIVPGIQGRWEWFHAVVDALAETHRVLTFSLCDEPSAGWRTTAEGIDGYADQIAAALDSRHIPAAAICGISFGGLVALRFAARAPERTTSLVLISAPGPDWHLSQKHERYTRTPWLFAPLFGLGALRRLHREVKVVFPTLGEELRFIAGYLATAARAPGSVFRMARRARIISAHDRAADASAVACPTLIVHGDPSLDHVVDVHGTRQYSEMIRGARVSLIERTGHLGFATRPREFARIVQRFLTGDVQSNHGSAA
jgi:pimeloyl-ACP methyl ester carboxylesterase